MGADFAMLVSCSVRDALNEDPILATEALVAEIKQRSSLDAVLLHHASGAMPKSILKVVLGPNGPVETTIPLEEMMASAQRLDALAARCDGCALRAEDKPFGCTGYIQYPITTSTEEWLVASMSEEGTLAAKLRKEARVRLKVLGDEGAAARPFETYFRALHITFVHDALLGVYA
jgi:hypothetical protein